VSTRSTLWLIPALLYGAFVYWYTDIGGPLSDAEIDDFMATMEANGRDPTVISFLETFARQDSGRQFLMVNNIDMNDHPGNVEGANPGETANDLMGRYMEHMIPALLARASHPVMIGSVIYPTMDLVGIEGAERWDQAALFRYRSRRTLLEIVTHPTFSDKHHFKTAALEKTIAYPIETTLYLSDPRGLLGLLLLAITAILDARLSRKNRS